jgi:hypothetical protein
MPYNYSPNLEKHLDFSEEMKREDDHVFDQSGVAWEPIKELIINESEKKNLKSVIELCMKKRNLQEYKPRPKASYSSKKILA